MMTGEDAASASWKQRVERDFGVDVAFNRTPSTPWCMFYLDRLALDADRGKQFAERVKKTLVDVSQDSLTTLQELVLDGDVDTTEYQIQRERDRASSSSSHTVTRLTAPSPASAITSTPSAYSFDLSSQNSLLQFAVLNDQQEMIQMLVDQGGQKLLDKGDLITGFTPFHFALFVENKQLMAFLISKGVDVDKMDSFHATAFDYARMLGLIPRSSSSQLATASQQTAQTSQSSASSTSTSTSTSTSSSASAPTTSSSTPSSIPSSVPLSISTPILSLPSHQIKFWNRDTNSLELWSVREFEQRLNVQFCPNIICDNDYVEELMFSAMGHQIQSSNIDVAFRQKYFPAVYEESGDDNVVLSFINSNVGYGVFAAQDFNRDDYIIRYGGKLTATDKIKDKSYLMESGVEGVGLDASMHRNLAGMINHSSSPNAMCQCVFDRGAEQAIITALTTIHKGEQILIDYSKKYWRKGRSKTMKLEDLKQILPSIPL